MFTSFRIGDLIKTTLKSWRPPFSIAMLPLVAAISSPQRHLDMFSKLVRKFQIISFYLEQRIKAAKNEKKFNVLHLKPHTALEDLGVQKTSNFLPYY